MKNPYEMSSPEWQMFENMMSHQHLISSFTADSERALQKAAQARKKFEQYQTALVKLDPEFVFKH
jgi:hypothetical protein